MSGTGGGKRPSGGDSPPGAPEKKLKKEEKTTTTLIEPIRIGGVSSTVCFMLLPKQKCIVAVGCSHAICNILCLEIGFLT